MIDGLRPYPELRESTHLWLSNVPTHWREKRAKHFYREVDERSVTGREELLSVSHKTGVTPRPKHVTMFLAESNVGHKICRPGDLVINTMWAFMGALGVAKQVGLVSPSYAVYRPFSTGELVPGFVDQLLRTPDYQTEYLCRSTGIRSSRLRLYPDQFLQIPILCPPPDEQAAIVRFLDHFDRRARLFIRAKRQLIAFLNEQKQAVVHRVVTRGLNPHVKLKPTGVRWLSDLPDHWDVKKLRFLADMKGGMTPSKARNDFWGGVIPWVSPKDMKRSEIGDSVDHISESALKETGIELVQPPAVLAVVRGMILARTFPVGVTSTPVTINQDMKALIPRENVLPWFLYWMLRGLNKEVLALVEEAGHGTRCLRTELWRDLQIPLPPVAEQQAIAAHLAGAMRKADQSESAALREIELMQEYRTRLFSDVVTGRLDVRKAAARLPDESGDADVISDLPIDDLELTDDQEPDAELEEVDA